MKNKTKNEKQSTSNGTNQVEKLEKELEATGKRSLNCSIILILVLIPFLLLLFFISNSNESPIIASSKSNTQN